MNHHEIESNLKRLLDFAVAVEKKIGVGLAKVEKIGRGPVTGVGVTVPAVNPDYMAQQAKALTDLMEQVKTLSAQVQTLSSPKAS